MKDDSVDRGNRTSGGARTRLVVGAGIGSAILFLLLLAASALRAPRVGKLSHGCQVLTLPGAEPDIEELLRRLSRGTHIIESGEAHLHNLDPGGRIRLDGRRAYEFHIGAPANEITSIEITEPDGSLRILAIPGDGSDVPFRIDVPFWGIHAHVLTIRTVHGDYRPLPLRLRGNLTADQLRPW